MSIERWTKESFLEEARMSRFSVDALMVQGVLAPGEMNFVSDLAKLVFEGHTPQAAYLRCIRACALLERCGRIETIYQNGRVCAVVSKDSSLSPTFQLDAQMNLAFRRTPAQMARDTKDRLAALYGEE